jgi:hypothetical protein
MTFVRPKLQLGFPDHQHPIDEEVMSEVRKAIDSWKEADTVQTRSEMQTVWGKAELHH